MVITATKSEPAWFPSVSAAEETPPALELTITLTYSDPEDERPWFAECRELPLTGEGDAPREAVGMLLEMAELYFPSLLEIGGWERVMQAAGLSIPPPALGTRIAIAFNIVHKGAVHFLMANPD